MTAKPLHVQVADALGVVICDRWKPLDFDPFNGWTYMKDCGHKECQPAQRAPRYDTDWSATGPLIERLGISVGPTYSGLDVSQPFAAAHGTREERGGTMWRYAHSPLEAACWLILALHAAGKLQPLLSAPASAK